MGDFTLWVNFESWVDFELWVTLEILVAFNYGRLWNYGWILNYRWLFNYWWLLNYGWGGDRHTDRQTTETHTHINSMTRPGLGAGLCKKFTHNSKVQLYFKSLCVKLNYVWWDKHTDTQTNRHTNTQIQNTEMQKYKWHIFRNKNYSITEI